MVASFLTNHQTLPEDLQHTHTQTHSECDLTLVCTHKLHQSGIITIQVSEDDELLNNVVVLLGCFQNPLSNTHIKY